jgi:hypothetical protein
MEFDFIDSQSLENNPISEHKSSTEYNSFENEPFEERYLEAGHYNSKLREGIRKSISNSNHYTIIHNWNHYPKRHTNIPKIEEVRILSRRGRNDRPQDNSSRRKLKTLTKRRIIRKNLSDII